MMTDQPLLEVNRIDVRYGDFQALRDISLRIGRGTVVSLIGANGAGKTTLLNTIMGISPPARGTIALEGRPVGGMATHRIVAQGISLVPEGSKVFQKMTVKENLLMGAYLPKARKERQRNLERVYGLFPVLKEKAEQTATFLSGGQRQMLAIGRAIMSEPQLLLCDEISLGLAPVIIQDIYATIREINRAGMTIVLVEQDVRRSLRQADYSYVMLKGRIVMEGRSAGLPEAEVRDAYFGENRYAQYG